MFKLKKALLMGGIYATVAAVAIGGTVAYLTSEDEKVNVMTLGEVKIEQIEQERDENGALVDFTDLKPAYPVVGDIAWDEDGLTVNGTDYKVFDDGLKNVVDKIVTVKNTGKSDAFVRTIVAIEAPDGDPNNLIHFNYNTTDVKMGDYVITEIDGVDYYVVEFTYKEKLAPGETSAPSLMQLFLDSTATNEDCAKFGDAWEVKVLSQAVQAAGFETADDAFDGVTTFAARSLLDAEVALDTAFGELNEPKAIEWFTDMDHNFVFTVEEMVAVCKTGGTMVLANDIVITPEDVPMHGAALFLINGKNVTVDLNGHDIIVREDVTHIDCIFFTGNPGGHINIVGDGNVIVKNGLATVVWVLQTGTANIYGGTYISNSVSHEAIVYSQGNGGVINVYGGTFVYDLDRHLNGGFNVSDQAGGNLRIILHEGVILNRPEYSQHLQGTNNGEQARIQLAEGCTLAEVTIDGATWYQVVK